MALNKCIFSLSALFLASCGGEPQLATQNAPAPDSFTLTDAVYTSEGSVATAPGTATSITVELIGALNNVGRDFFIMASNAGGATLSNAISLPDDVVVALITYIKASNTEPSDLFGSSIALSGDSKTLAVGAIYESSGVTGIDGDQNDNSIPFSGAVYLYRNVNGSWQQQSYIKPPNTESGDNFGQDVALSDDGNTLVISAEAEGSNATGIDGDASNNDASSAGAVFAYEYINGAWSNTAYIKASNTDSSDKFGYAIDLSSSGDLLAVGAIGESSNASSIEGDQTDNSVASAGATYIFRNTNGVWSQEAYIKPSSATGNFGFNVSFDSAGTTLAVAAVNANSQGRVYVFTSDGAGSWSEQAFIDASNGESGDRFGGGLALSGDAQSLFVGAAHEGSGVGGINAGGENDNTATRAGAVYAYHYDGTAWVKQAYIKPQYPTSFGYFGESLATNLSGDLLAVGFKWESSSSSGFDGNQDDSSLGNSGAVFVYRKDTNEIWQAKHYIKALYPQANAEFGFDVSLDNTGDTLVVSSDIEGSAATGINGDQSDTSAIGSGAVFVY